MNRKIIALLLALVLALSLAACGGEEETTLTGMVVSVDGTVVSLVEMSGSMEDMDFSSFSGEFDGTMPEGFDGSFPEDFDGTMPEGFDGSFPEDFDGTMPEGFEGGFPGGMPEDFDGTLPEGETYPQQGEGSFPGGMMGGMMGAFSGDTETTDVDIADAHISLEADGVKTSGTLEDIQPGSFVTITLNGKGEATYVLVSEGFGGRGMGRTK